MYLAQLIFAQALGRVALQEHFSKDSRGAGRLFYRGLMSVLTMQVEESP